MYIENVVIKNVRCFKNLTLDLGSPKGPKKWTVIVGDNGMGKTTLLRCIAAGLCDTAGAAALFRDTYGEWRRRDIRKGDKSYIEINLRDGTKTYSMKTEIAMSPAGWETVTVKTPGLGQTEFPWDSIFVCGYGANRRTTQASRPEEYYAPDAVYTLFNYDYGLQDPELGLRRIAGLGKGAKKTVAEVCDWLRQVLMLDKAAVRLLKTGMKVRGPWGDETLGTLGDGYEATLTWLLDLLSWAILAKKRRSRRLRGIVLLDELEQYLHPRWQRQIIAQLHRTFPSLQFITTTHSPICAAGTADIPGEDAKLVLLDLAKDGSVELVDDLPSVAGMRSDQVLASRVFGYIIEANPRTELLLRKASILAGKGEKRTPAEERRYGKLKRELEEALAPKGQTLVEREIEEEAYQQRRQKAAALERKLFGKET